MRKSELMRVHPDFKRLVREIKKQRDRTDSQITKDIEDLLRKWQSKKRKIIL